MRSGSIIWTGENLSESPILMEYNIRVPPGESGKREIKALVEYHYLGNANPDTKYADPDTIFLRSPQLPFSENFNDGQAQLFREISGRWQLGRYRALSQSPEEMALSLLPELDLPEQWIFKATINVGTDGYFRNGLLIFDYQSMDDFKFVQAAVGSRQWFIGQKDMDGFNILAEVGDESMAVNTDYVMKVTVDNGGVGLWVNGEFKLSHRFDDELNGPIGLGNRLSETRFDDVSVNEPEASV